MTNIERFSKSVVTRITRDNHELNERHQDMNGKMKELLAKRAVFRDTSASIITEALLPRVQEFARHFKNARVSSLDSALDRSRVACDFSHTSRFPAKVTLSMALTPCDDFQKLTIHYDLMILPMFIDYQQHHEKSFVPDEREEIGQWVEERLLEFLETYLLLETHPLYQKDNLVVDPVCNMKFPLDEAAATVESHGVTLYFCSDVCKKAFLSERS